MKPECDQSSVTCSVFLDLFARLLSVHDRASAIIELDRLSHNCPDQQCVPEWLTGYLRLQPDQERYLAWMCRDVSARKVMRLIYQATRCQPVQYYYRRNDLGIYHSYLCSTHVLSWTQTKYRIRGRYIYLNDYLNRSMEAAIRVLNSVDPLLSNDETSDRSHRIWELALDHLRFRQHSQDSRAIHSIDLDQESVLMRVYRTTMPRSDYGKPEQIRNFRASIAITSVEHLIPLYAPEQLSSPITTIVMERLWQYPDHDEHVQEYHIVPPQFLLPYLRTRPAIKSARSASIM